MKLQYWLLGMAVLLSCLVPNLLSHLPLAWHEALILYVTLPSIWIIEGAHFARKGQKAIWVSSQIASWLIAAAALFSGLMGLCYSTIAGQGDIGFWVGLIFGSLLGGACLLWIGLVLYGVEWGINLLLYQIDPLLCKQASQTQSDQEIQHHPSSQNIFDNLQAPLPEVILFILLPIAKGLGLGTIAFAAAYAMGPMGLILMILWGLALSWFVFQTSHYLQNKFGKFQSVLILGGVVGIGLGLGSLINI